MVTGDKLFSSQITRYYLQSGAEPADHFPWILCLMNFKDSRGKVMKITPLIYIDSKFYKLLGWVSLPLLIMEINFLKCQ